MALSIKTDKADRLARELARLTGETMTTAVTVALEERLERERAARETDLVGAIEAFVAKHKNDFISTLPVTPEEWEWAGGDGL
jgi:antitoxin VapB